MTFFILILLLLFNFINCFHFLGYSIIQQHHQYKKCFEHLIESENKILLFTSINNSHHYKNELLNIYCNYENINFESIQYDDFINYNYNEKSDIIYINDFLTYNGRIMLNEEKDIILKYNKSAKLILNVEDSDNLILIDHHFLNKFNDILFPKMNKYILNTYIYNLIEHYHFDDLIHTIHWSSYDINQLSLKEIENLIYKIHLSYQLKKDIDKDYIKKLIYVHMMDSIS